MTTPAILAYVRTGNVLTGANYTVLPDYTNNLVYSTLPLSNWGLAKFNGYSDDSDLLEQFLTTWPLVIGSPQSLLYGAFELSSSGHILLHTSHNTGFPAHPVRTYVVAIRASDLSYTSQIEIPGSYTLASMVPLVSGSTEYVIAGSAITTGAHASIDYAPVPGLTSYTTLFTIDEKFAFLGRGATGSTGTAFVLGAPAATTGSFGLYKISSVGGAAPTQTKLGTVSPAQVDAAWTNITTYSGVAYDKTDGHVLVRFHTTDAGAATKHYVVKLSSVDASVIWTSAIGSTSEGSYGEGIRRSNITAQTFYVLSGTTLYTINTTDGSSTSATIGTLTPAATTEASQISDDASTSIIVHGTWSQTTTTPTYLGTYMGTDGNHAVASNCWLRYFPIGAPVPPVPTPPAPPFPIVSVNRAWTYTMDGHTFYVLDLGGEGTFVYDTDTQQWSEFQTNGANWAMTNGCMFGNRVVAGDTATTDVWELVPSAVKDSGALAYEITHIATGGLAVRTRAYISCASFRLSASFGQLDDVAGVNISLAFSDDQGQTWVTPDVIALTEGSYSQEIAWRSLGSFAAPGRIFQITDSGGVIRIDGADAMLDNFDDEKQPSEQG